MGPMGEGTHKVLSNALPGTAPGQETTDPDLDDGNCAPSIEFFLYSLFEFFLLCANPLKFSYVVSFISGCQHFSILAHLM